jgi:hypothetical protein
MYPGGTTQTYKEHVFFGPEGASAQYCTQITEHEIKKLGNRVGI